MNANHCCVKHNRSLPTEPATAVLLHPVSHATQTSLHLGLITGGHSQTSHREAWKLKLAQRVNGLSGRRAVEGFWVFLDLANSAGPLCK